MKIVFLQNTIDTQGGIIIVNKTLGQAFLENGDEVYYVSLRRGVVHSEITYPKNAKNILINHKAIWDTPRLISAANAFRKGKIFSGASIIAKRFFYDIGLRKDFRKCAKLLTSINPDIIICSHYELLDCIPKKLLSRSINHFHNTFEHVLLFRSYRKFFLRYKDRLGKFIWLTRASCEAAKKFGLSNSDFIYNPIAFTSKTVADLSQKKVLFLGRFCEQKRLDLIVSLFQKTVAAYSLWDWHLNLYGIGTLDPDIEQKVLQDPQISLCGSTTTPKEIMLQHSLFMMTSDFEGLPLVVLEAYECGLPVIAFDYGESAAEIIQPHTGKLLPYGDQNSYVHDLGQLMQEEALRKQLGKEAKEFAVQFHTDLIVKQWRHLFLQLQAKEAKND